MSVKEQTCYRLVCDGCESTTSEEDWHWQTPAAARLAVDDDEWLSNFSDGKDYCAHCREKVVHEHNWNDGVCETCLTFQPEDEEGHN